MRSLKLLCVCFVMTAAVVLSISPVAFAETEKALNVYSVSSALINPPTVVMEYDGTEDISAFVAEVSSSMVRPATMIAEVDGDFNVSVNTQFLLTPMTIRTATLFFAITALL